MNRVIPGYNDLLTVNPDLAKQWHPTKNSMLTPSDITHGSGKKVWWICEKGHEWQEAVTDRDRGNGCPFCSGRRVLTGFNDLATINPDLAKQWHPTKNGILTPSDITHGSGKKVWWLCEKGHEWQETVTDRDRGNGCPFCSSRRVLIGFNDLKSQRPDIAKQWHPTKNGNLKPSELTYGSETKVWWLCEKGHEWQTSPNRRTCGTGCPYCAGRKVWPGFNDLATQNPSLAKQWHPTKNRHLTPLQISNTSTKSVWWICENGHEWQASIYNRNKGIGCPFCSGKKPVNGVNDLATLHPDVAARWHPTKNGETKPEIFMSNSGKKVWWICEKGHEWQATIQSQSKGSQCPFCWGELKTSFPEQSVFYYIKKYFPDAINRYKKNRMELDVFIPSLQVGIEYDGERFHTDLDKDIKKTKFFKSHKIELYRIRENGCPPLVGDDDHIILIKAANTKELSKAIHILLMKLGLIIPDDEIDISRDSSCIQSLYLQREKENSLASTYPSIAKEWHPTRNGCLTPWMIPPKSSRKIWWICEEGHEWQATPANRTKDVGCPYCAGRLALYGVNDLATKNPILAKQWHPTKNGNLTPNDVKQGSEKNVWWLCEKGHEWQAPVYRRSAGSGCPYCSGNETIIGRNDLASVDPDLSKQWHPIKNGDLTPFMLKPRSGKKVWWLCEKGHEWQAVVASRTAGSGCPYCAGRKVWPGFNDLAAKNHELSLMWHPTKNGTLLPTDVAPFSHRVVWWTCMNGHEWSEKIVNMSLNPVCPYCFPKAKKIIRKK